MKKVALMNLTGLFAQVKVVLKVDLCSLCPEMLFGRGGGTRPMESRQPQTRPY